MQPRISMITLGTKNLRRATDFYAQGLGFPQLKMAEGDITFFTLSSTWLALYPWDLLAADATIDPKGSGFRGVTFSHNVGNEEEVLALFDAAKQAGAQCLKVPQKTEWGGFSGYFSDLDDHVWEIAFNPFFWPGPQDHHA